MPEGPVVIQRDLNRLEEWADRNLSGNVHTLKHRSFHLNPRENFFIKRLTKHWHKLPREAISPSRETTTREVVEYPLDMVPGSLL